MSNIAFIGGGNMATSLIGGLIADGRAADGIWVSDTQTAKLDELRDGFGVHTTTDNNEAVAHCETVVLAVKPQVMAEVVRGIADAVAKRRCLCVSIAAGVRETDMRRWLNFDAPIVRTMPNTPALLRCGAAALYANTFVSNDQRERAQAVLGAVGTTLWVEDESLLDAVTAVSGSGPAYLFLLVEMMENAGVELGLPRETARGLAQQTAYGASRMVRESDDDPATLRARVTSPAGTTEAAITSLERGGVEKLFLEALTAARDRSIELGKLLGEQ